MRLTKGVAVLCAAVSMGVSLVGCGETPEANGGDEVAIATPLRAAGLSAWTTIPGPGGGVFFKNRPAMLASYSGPTNRITNVCATSYNLNVYCSYRVVLGSSDPGWSTWTAVTPPPGVAIGGSGPTMAGWTDLNGMGWSGLAARQSPGSGCTNCINLQISQHAGGSTWYSVPNSSFSNGDFNLVYSQGYLYLVVSNGGPTYNAWYSRNYVLNGYSNSNWDTWQQIPGGGVFTAPVRAVGLSLAGGVLVSGPGTDKQAYFQKFAGVWDGWWQIVGAGRLFKDGPAPTNLSGYGDDIEFFGMGTDNVAYAGSLNAAHSQFDGWYNDGGGGFYTGATAVVSGPNHVDLAALANSQLVRVASYDQ